ncbi:MAG: protein-L-isoaspartate O-methyltransferase [Desulfurococcales archaeon ex4484_58]|nr:MAG: protein-L-isoaspartate O-methyltransferase [Desulfurococcales archaeon ex4484_58]
MVCYLSKYNYISEREYVIDYLVRLGYLKNPLVIKALKTVPREEFIPEHLRRYAYVDQPLPIGYGQTISAIHMVAIMTEELDPKPGNKVLEIGTGSGYQAAVLAEIVAKSDPEKKGFVYTIERISELAEFARRNLSRTGYDKYVKVIVGDGTLGYPDEAPYDRIIVTAGAPDVPKPLIEQLSIGGRMVIPVGDKFLQRLLVLDKKESKIDKRWGIECVFVPLVGEYGWKE